MTNLKAACLVRTRKLHEVLVFTYAGLILMGLYGIIRMDEMIGSAFDSVKGVCMGLLGRAHDLIEKLRAAWINAEEPGPKNPPD